MSDLKDGEPENRIINEPMSEALSKRYLAYALSTITARARGWMNGDAWLTA